MGRLGVGQTRRCRCRCWGAERRGVGGGGGAAYRRHTAPTEAAHIAAATQHNITLCPPLTLTYDHHQDRCLLHLVSSGWSTPEHKMHRKNLTKLNDAKTLLLSKFAWFCFICCAKLAMKMYPWELFYKMLCASIFHVQWLHLTITVQFV